jgi:hypothetical protein
LLAILQLLFIAWLPALANARRGEKHSWPSLQFATVIEGGSFLSVLTEFWHAFGTAARERPALVTFITAALGTAFGAYLTSRSAAKKRVVDELKAIRAAYALCQTIINGAFAIKGQHIRSMKERFDVALAAVEAHQLNPQGQLQLDLDLNTLSQVTFPTDRLLGVVFEKCSPPMKCLTIAVQLHTSTTDLKASIDGRNELIKAFQEKTPETEIAKLRLYFGLPGPNGVDARFRSNLQALSHQTDDCIVFSVMLAEELLKYGNSIHRRNRRWYRLGMRKMVAGDWSIAIAAGLLPPRAAYSDWDNKFIYPPTRWQLFKRAFQSARWVDWKELL